MVDEVQRITDLLEVSRPVSDDPKRRIVFLLLERAFLDFVKGISETLAGRIRLIDFNGFSLSEDRAGAPRPLWLCGGFPEPMLFQPLKLGRGEWSPLRVLPPRERSVGRGAVRAGRNRFLATDRCT